ncbi:MAG: MBL fold metallo-hydrolase [Eubacteriaceae bacterium]|nr:MBL fold metallo-hydrolase [Eubacteriaceae bacterium]
MKLEITLLHHSGFLVKTPKHVLVFDYWRHMPQYEGIDYGAPTPKEFKGEDLLVFVSHRHPDHYDPLIFSFGEHAKKARWILSSDVNAKPEDTSPSAIYEVSPGESHNLVDDCRILTYGSTDAGVSFLVEIDGARILHCGDLNWWHWGQDSVEEQKKEEESFKSELDKIEGKIDVAFVPVDPRLGEAFSWAAAYALESKDIVWLVPMHFGDDISVPNRLAMDLGLGGYKEKIVTCLVKRGESTAVEI